MTDGVCPFARWVPGVTTFTNGCNDRVGFCDHTAGGYFGTLASVAFWNRAGVSAHFAISEAGEIVQLVNLFDTAWAQGKDANGNSVGQSSPGVTWAPFAEMRYSNPNNYLISTEHEDKTVPDYVWSDAMYAADLRLKQWCVEECKRVRGFDALRFGQDSLAGHYMFDPVNRAHCPGEGWPQQKLWEDLAAMNAAPTTDEQIRALVALAHFIRNGWNLADLSAEDKAAIQYAVDQIPA